VWNGLEWPSGQEVRNNGNLMTETWKPLIFYVLF